MHVGDQAIVAHRRDDPHAPARRTSSPARISGDRFALFLPNDGLEGARAFLDGLCDAISKLDFDHEGKRIALSIELRRREPSRAPSFRCRTRSLHAEVGLQGREGSWSRPRRAVSGRRSQHRAPLRRRGDHRRPARGDRQRSLPHGSAADRRAGAIPVRARRFELLLRMIDPARREHRAGQVPHGRRALPARDRHRSLGRAVRAGDPVVGRAARSRAWARTSRSTSPASRSATSSSRFISSRSCASTTCRPALLSFEITETAAVANIVRAEMLIRRLQDLGHAIALDDFGRGLSSLTYLKSLPVSHLKIDGGLVRDLAGNARSQADGDRDRAAGAGDEARDHGGMRRERSDPRRRRPARCDLWAGFRNRPAAAARDRLAGAASRAPVAPGAAMARSSATARASAFAVFRRIGRPACVYYAF